MANIKLTFLIEDLPSSFKENDVKVRKFVTGIDREIESEFHEKYLSLAIFNESNCSITYALEMKPAYVEMTKCLMHNLYGAKSI